MCNKKDKTKIMQMFVLAKEKISHLDIQYMYLTNKDIRVPVI